MSQNQQNIGPHTTNPFLLAIWNAFVFVGEIVVSLAIVALSVTGCAPVEPDPTGGIRTECAADGGPTSQTVCAQGQYAYCFEEGDAGILRAACCNVGVSSADCERGARRDR